MTRPLRQDRVNVPAFRGEERLDRRFSVGRFFNEFGHVVCGGIFLVVFDPRDLARSPLTRVPPGSRAIDCLAVDLEPTPHLCESLFHNDWDCAVGFWTYVEQEVAATADGVHSDEHQFAASVINLDIFGAVIAITLAP